MMRITGILLLLTAAVFTVFGESPPDLRLYPTIPVRVVEGVNMVYNMKCDHNYEGPVKTAQWFKVYEYNDKRLFYKYDHDGTGPQLTVQSIPHLNVNVADSNGNTVNLYDMNEQTSGQFECIVVKGDGQQYDSQFNIAVQVVRRN